MAVAILTGLIVGLFATGSAWFLIRQESVRAGVQRGTAVRKAKIQVITSRLTKDLEVTNSLEYQFGDHKGEWTWNDVKQFEKQINDIGVPLSDHLDRELPGSGASVLIRDVVGEVGKGPVHYEYSRLLALRASIRNVIERLEFYVDRSSINQGPNPRIENPTDKEGSMDPDAGRFHELASELEEEIAERKGWIKFHRGELVSIKGQQFRVVDIGELHVILKSVASDPNEGLAQLRQVIGGADVVERPG